MAYRTFNITVTVDIEDIPHDTDDVAAEYANEMEGVAIGAILDSYRFMIHEPNIMSRTEEVS